MLIIGGRIDVDPGEVDAFADAMRRLAQAAGQVDGNQLFAVAVEDRAAGRVLVFERWRDKAALDAFIALPALADFFATWGPRMRNRLRKFDAQNERAPQE